MAGQRSVLRARFRRGVAVALTAAVVGVLPTSAAAQTEQTDQSTTQIGFQGGLFDAETWPITETSAQHGLTFDEDFTGVLSIIARGEELAAPVELTITYSADQSGFAIGDFYSDDDALELKAETEAAVGGSEGSQALVVFVPVDDDIVELNATVTATLSFASEDDVPAGVVLDNATKTLALTFRDDDQARFYLLDGHVDGVRQLRLVASKDRGFDTTVHVRYSAESGKADAAIPLPGTQNVVPLGISDIADLVGIAVELPAGAELGDNALLAAGSCIVSIIGAGAVPATFPACGTESTTGTPDLTIGADVNEAPRIPSGFLSETAWVSISQPVAVAAAGSPPEGPADVKIGRVRRSSVTLSWNAVVGASHYEVMYRRRWPTGPQQSVIATSTRHTISGLSRGTAYGIRVRAVFDAEAEAVSAWSRRRTVRTKT